MVGRRHAADWVAEPALVAAVVGAVDRLHGHGLIACREGCSVVCSEEPAALRPFSGNDGAWGHAAQVGGAQAFDQDGCRALDDGSSYRRWGGAGQHESFNKTNTPWGPETAKSGVFFVELGWNVQEEEAFDYN